MDNYEFDNRLERCPLWDAEVGLNRFINVFMGSYGDMSLDELDSLA